MSLNDIGKQIRHEESVNEYLIHCQNKGTIKINPTTITLPKQRRQ